MERIDALVADLRQLDGLMGVNAAVLNGKQLDTMRTDLLARLRESPRGPVTKPPDQAAVLAQMVALGARLKVS